MRFSVTALLFSTALLAADTTDKDVKEVDHRLGTATAVFSEIMATPDKGIPRDLLERAHCIVVVPGVKQGAFLVGGKYGKGFVSCRAEGRGWSAPGAVRVEGGSFGFQIGGSETDVVMLVMNERGADKLLSDKFTLGAQGEVAAGPVGRTAAADTDAMMHAEILSWSRSRGVFAGISLQGATLRPDDSDNEALYGKRVHNRDIVKGQYTTPAAAREFISILDRYSMHEKA